jgi:hypothetical protein
MRLQEKFQEREEFRLLSEKQSSLFIGKGFDLLLEYLTENGEVRVISFYYGYLIEFVAFRLLIFRRNWL